MHPIKRTAGVIHPHGDKMRQPLHHKWFARRPHNAPPDQVIQPKYRTLYAVRHPIIRAPLHCLSLTKTFYRQERLCAGDGNADSIRRQCDSGQGHRACGDRLACSVAGGNIVRRRCRKSDIRPGSNPPVTKTENILHKLVARRAAGVCQVVIEIDQARAAIHCSDNVAFLGYIQIDIADIDLTMAHDHNSIFTQVRWDRSNSDIQCCIGNTKMINIGLDEMLKIRIESAG